MKNNLEKYTITSQKKIKELLELNFSPIPYSPTGLSTPELIHLWSTLGIFIKEAMAVEALTLKAYPIFFVENWFLQLTKYAFKKNKIDLKDHLLINKLLTYNKDIGSILRLICTFQNTAVGFELLKDIYEEGQCEKTKSPK